MFLPVGDQPNPRGTPIANYAILALNVLIYVGISLPLSLRPADPSDPRIEEYVEVIRQNLPPGVSIREVLRQVSEYDLFVFDWGYRPAEPSLLALFASMFLHGGFAHLFGNMLFLWIYGDNVEHRLGSPRYVVWYLVTGACATLFHSVFDFDSRIPLVGASGAISGVLGFYFVWFPRNQVRVWVLLFPFFMNVVHLPARLVLGFYLILDNIFPFLLSRGTGGAGVAYGAHIGGFLAGLAVAWLKNRREVVAQPEEYRDLPRATGPTPRESLQDALRREDMARAAPLYFELSADESRRLLSPDDSIALANWLAKNGHSRAALTVYQRHLRDYPRGPGAAEAHAYGGLLLLHAFREPTAAYQHLVEALELDPDPELESLIRRALRDIESLQKMQVPRFH
ncbi:MAG TPA: rhomboid family intramembrane serine protease [Vicinamibacteria bacterium]|nr:rhomboid family intramembrane serine protease [Vicinamibacteria bacterium]